MSVRVVIAPAPLALALLAAACSGSSAADLVARTESSTVATVPRTTSPASDTPPTTPPPTTPPPTTPPPLTAPAWLHERTIPTDAEGYGLAQPTPPELIDRQLPTVDVLPPPPTATFVSTIGPLEGESLARSTWREGCPVDPDELRYVTVTFWGFDQRAHTGELILHAEVAEDVVGVFAVAFDERFPVEEMRIVTPDDLDAPPTGDTNNTASYVCRAATGGTRFSEHAYGLAVDVNPFHNPYVRGDRVLPELATSYTDRTDPRVGMLSADHPVVEAFAAIGWSWGGNWTSLKDYHHFSHNNR